MLFHLTYKTLSNCSNSNFFQVDFSNTVRFNSLCTEINCFSAVQLFCELPCGLYKVQKELLALYASRHRTAQFAMNRSYPLAAQ
jgi:hypothetical protein